ncbi:MAG TPA: hypothetical protein VLV88_03935, partial [Terriglobales bacterium]|nr:hypothetical protein [Terriglobales bacterium]
LTGLHVFDDENADSVGFVVHDEMRGHFSISILGFAEAPANCPIARSPGTWMGELPDRRNGAAAIRRTRRAIKSSPRA